MTMTILNNPAAMLSMGELNKNVSALGKQLKKVVTGTKITGAGDGASEYSISERMRVRIRALEQDAANVQTGKTMLNVAAGAIQEQLEIMKTIKAKVIDANNDTNTEVDRLMIQKEIAQGFEQIHNIAYETNYNGKLLLVGDKKVEEIQTWRILDKPEPIPDSDTLNLIEDQYDTLDGQTGPFATLPFYSEEAVTIEPLLGDLTSKKLEGGAAGYYDPPLTASPAAFTVDFSGYDTSNAEGVGFYTASNSSGASAVYYVLTNNPTGKNYRRGAVPNENVVEININGLDSAGIASAVASAISGSGIVGSANSSGTVVSITTSYPGSAANQATVKGWSQSAGSAEKTIGGGESRKYGRSSALATGLGDQIAKGVPASKGTYVPETYKEYHDPVTDITTQVVDVPAHYEGGSGGSPASLPLDVGGVPAGAGFAIDCSGTSGAAYVRIVDGSSITRDSTGVYEVGREAVLSDYKLCTWDTYKPNNAADSYVRLSMSNGQMTLTSVYSGATITTTDGFSEVAGADAIAPTTTTVNFEAVTAYTGNVTVANGGVDQGPYHEGPRASYTMNLTAYDTTDNGKMEEFISALKGKALSTSGVGTIEFLDSKVPTSLDAVKHFAPEKTITFDLHAIRTYMTTDNTKTVADAFISLMSAQSAYLSDGSDSSAGTKGLKVTAYARESDGNNQEILLSQGNMSSYTIDFAAYVSGNSLSLPDDLDGKGFRVYCATCADQWFNFLFKSKDDSSDSDRPASGQSGADIKTTIIDIAGVTDVKSLVQAIYDQGGDAMEHIMNGGPHTLHFAADPEAGTITVYDDRKFDLRDYSRQYPYLQEKGVKLADGVLDDVQEAMREVYVRDMVIHHTDKASMNIHVQIPQTSMDHLFQYIPGGESYTDYNVMTRAGREKLLGNQGGRMTLDGMRMVKKDEPGLLDQAIDYLTTANTLVGAQNSRLGLTYENIIAQQEGTTFSESTIRDANMAKEMTEYVKYNVLTQSAQSMLAQANQNSSSVLSLLQ